MNDKRKYIGWLSGLTLLLTTACSSLADLDVKQVGNEGTPRTVTITVQPESQLSGMRAADAEINNGESSTISKGSKVDVLIYAVYKKKADGTYSLLTTDDVTEKPENTTEVLKPGEGQTVLSFTDKHEQQIILSITDDANYKVAFWAQSSKTTAFDASNLEKVKVEYEDAQNNDELRDAFCTVVTIDGSSTIYRAILRRPFAQINVGTTGADYKNILIGKYVYPNKKVTQSQIKLTGVAQYFNVVEDKVVEDEELIDVTFTYDTIPAFMNMKVLPTGGYLYNGENDDEEFLRVDLNRSGKFKGYKTSYPTIRTYTDAEGKKKVKYLTETFKYLSMCYALVPAETEGIAEEAKEYVSAVLPSVEVSFAETNNNGEVQYGYTPIKLTNVPVKRNWRTNILGGLRNMTDPTDPDPDNPDPDNPDPDNPDPDDPDPDDPDPDEPDPDEPDPDEPEPGPDDPTSVFGLVNLTIDIEPMFNDEHNGTNDEEDSWIYYSSGTPEEETPEGDDQQTNN